MAGYFGRKSDMIVHHLAQKKPECGLYPTKKEDRVYFTPDTLKSAKELGFIPCMYCIDQ